MSHCYLSNGRSMLRSRFVIDPGVFIVLWSYYKTGEMKEWLMGSFSTGASQGEGNCVTPANKEPRRQRGGSDGGANGTEEQCHPGFICKSLHYIFLIRTEGGEYFLTLCCWNVCHHHKVLFQKEIYSDSVVEMMSKRFHCPRSSDERHLLVWMVISSHYMKLCLSQNH